MLVYSQETMPDVPIARSGLVFARFRKQNVSERERANIVLTLVTMGCLLILMVKREINEKQNYLLLETISRMTKASDLEHIAYRVSDKLAEMNGAAPNSVLDFFSIGEKLNENEREMVAYTCLSCAILDSSDEVMCIAGHICRELKIPEWKMDGLFDKAIQDTGGYRVMGNSKEHLTVKPILDDALLRVKPMRIP